MLNRGKHTAVQGESINVKAIAKAKTEYMPEKVILGSVRCLVRKAANTKMSKIAQKMSVFGY